MRSVMVFGTFDLLHEGHRFLFREAKKHGDSLTVVVARDKNVLRVKGNEPAHKEQDRLRHVRAEPHVDRAVLGHIDDVYRILEETRPAVICLGYDQRAFTDTLEAELARRNITATVIRLPAYRPETYKSSLIKKSNSLSTA